MSFSNTQLIKYMLLQLFYNITNPQKNNKNMSFSNMQLIKNMLSHFIQFINIYDIICNNNIRRIQKIS